MKYVSQMLFLAFLPAAAWAADPPKLYPDVLPPERARLVEQRAAEEQNALAKLPAAGDRFILSQRRWPTGSRLLVAFNGGPPELHRDIATVAAKWMRAANITLDFGYNPRTKTYRTWSRLDTARVAHIRIGFDEPGYWSAVGTDSMVDGPFSANMASMNFGGFKGAWPILKPYKWESVVVHEFGHALGFRHDHQRQVCANEIRWTPGPNPSTEPSLYMVMMEEQGWNAAMVDANYKPVVTTEPSIVSPEPDTRSAMFYPTSYRALIKGRDSVCYLAEPNSELSPTDIRGAQLAYPDLPPARGAAQPLRSAPELIASASAPLTPEEGQAIAERAAAALAAARPILFIHIQREADRPLAKEIAQAGITAKFLVPGIENVAKKKLKSGKTQEIRYFREEHADAAHQAAAVTTAITGVPTGLRFAKQYGKRVTENKVELWLP